MRMELIIAILKLATALVVLANHALEGLLGHLFQ